MSVETYDDALAGRTSATPRLNLPLALRFALREMRGGLGGFLIFLACIALGTAAIAGVNSVARSITEGIASEGRAILAGDLRIETEQRPMTAEERAFFDARGDTSLQVSMRSMARLADGSDQTLVELKAVDGAYPLYGDLVLEPPVAEPFAPVDGTFGAVAPQTLLDRLEIGLGERLLIGSTEVELRAILATEPDALSDGFGFAPRLMIGVEALEAADLRRPGSLYEEGVKLRLPPGTSDAAVAAIRDEANAAFPQAGWSIRDRGNAAPALSANITRFGQFLTLVGLTALVVGGVGVANAVRAHLDGKRGVIATLKCVGASGGFVFALYFVQVMLLAVIGVAAGLVLGALAAPVAHWFLQGTLPIPAGAGFYPGALGYAALFGLLTAAAFAMLPLGRARDVAPASLFRSRGFDTGGLPRWPFLLAAALLIALLAGLAILTSYDREVAAMFLGATAVTFVVLRGVAWAIQWLARRAPTVRSTPLRLAIGNIHRPGALTPSVVLSLGLGLALLVTLAMIDGNLRRQISDQISADAPNFFFVDIPSTEIDPFRDTLGEVVPSGKVVAVPMLRGRVIALRGTPVEELDIRGEGAWVLRGDRGLTYAANVPENSTIAAGEWWPADYAGPPLVSFAAEEAGELGLSVGDEITVNVLGRDITATIANLREVSWESLGINFVMVFDPGTLAAAPHAWLATLLADDLSEDEERGVVRAVTNAFPSVTSVRVAEALDVVERVVGQLATAIRAAAAVALVASVLVLAGALAAGNRGRVYDSVVLKVLGATRRTLIRAFVTEYAILGAATALFALLAGSAAGWFVVTQIMGAPFVLLPGVAIGTVVAALVLTVGFGLLGTWRVLGEKAAPVLRNL